MNTFYDCLFEKTYGVKLADITDKQAKNIQKAVARLRLSYKNSVTPTMYDQDDIRKAYMIGYYPHSMHVSNEVMQLHVLPHVPQKDIVNISFFAGGPCPEYLGALNAIACSARHNKLNAVTYDKESNWLAQQRISYDLGKQLKGKALGTLHYFDKCNMKNSCQNCDCSNWCHAQLAKTDIIYVQNLLSHIDNETAVLNKLKRLLNIANKDAVLVIIDYDYAQTKNVLNILTDNSCVKCLDSNIDKGYTRSRTPLIMPQQLKDKIFIGENSLQPRFYTNYYYGVFKKAA